MYFCHIGEAHRVGYSAHFNKHLACKVDEDCTALNGWFLINRLIDTIFIIDMVLCFFVMFPIEDNNNNYQARTVHAGDSGTHEW